MRFMIIVKATAESEIGIMPGEELLSAMTDYHEELSRAGVLLDAAGLQPSSNGWRVRIHGGKRRVIDGPFAGTGELVAGYTLIQVDTRKQALEWSRRFPNPSIDGSDCEIEVRQLFEPEDFDSGRAIDRSSKPGSKDTE